MPTQLLAAQVTHLTGNHRNGQTFLTWTIPSPTIAGWTYRLYSAASPIITAGDLNSATLVGSVGDSTWCDRRLSTITGTIYGYAIDSLAPPLDSTRGLFVVTPATAGNRYYAVTAQSSGDLEDQGLTPSQNSLTSPVVEIPTRPRPVYQRTLVNYVPLDVYALWTSPVDAPDVPAMANRWGEAFDCAVHPGGTSPSSWHALVVSFHVRGGNFFYCPSAGLPGEWGLCMDDFTHNLLDVNTWWYGYHQNYNTEYNSDVPTPPPTSGQVFDYTRRRIAYTIEWARDNFPIDRSRVYAIGSSMGGSGALMFSFWRPDLFAAAYAVIPRVNMAHADDPDLYPNPFPPPPSDSCAFNPGQGQRWTCDHLWGKLASNLPGPSGGPVYNDLSGPALAASRESGGIIPIVTLNGRLDATVGWAEKPGFYAAMDQHRQGGIFFWDQRNHPGGPQGGWNPMYQPSYLYRFRGDRSFPALSKCSANGDPGDGTFASGDTLGAINAFVEWDSLVTDMPSVWQVHFTLRDLATQWGPRPAPESLTVDVTPRRLQQFATTPGQPYAYEVQRVTDHANVQTGSVAADPLGLITVPAVKVYKRGGTWLTITSRPVGVETPVSPVLQLRVSPRNPVRDVLVADVEWPANGPAALVLFDLSGRRRHTVFAGIAAASQAHIQARLVGTPPGIYFLQAEQAGRAAVARVAIIR